MPVTLTIRAAQLAVFSGFAEQTFEDWMAGHLKKFFSGRCNAIGETGIRELIRHGRKRASEHGFKSRCDVCKYIDLMLVFGRDFDTRSKWAARILARAGDRSSTMLALFAAADRQLNKQ